MSKMMKALAILVLSCFVATACGSNNGGNAQGNAGGDTTASNANKGNGEVKNE